MNGLYSTSNRISHFHEIAKKKNKNQNKENHESTNGRHQVKMTFECITIQSAWILILSSLQVQTHVLAPISNK